MAGPLLLAASAPALEAAALLPAAEALLAVAACTDASARRSFVLQRVLDRTVQFVVQLLVE